MAVADDCGAFQIVRQVLTMRSTNHCIAGFEVARRPCTGSIARAGMPLGEALVLPGSVRERLTVGLVVGNRNVGLVWSAFGAAATPRMALYFAATQLPIYIMPRLLEALLARSRKDCPVTGVSGRAVTIEGNADDTI
jgi:BASS family bile acid:Na+ symporter